MTGSCTPPAEMEGYYEITTDPPRRLTYEQLEEIRAAVGVGGLHRDVLVAPGLRLIWHPRGTLDVAWAEAYALVPEGCGLVLTTAQRGVRSVDGSPISVHSARLWRNGSVVVSFDADDPVAALNGLAGKLRQ